MADSSKNSNTENSFWKMHIRTIPGRPSPKKVISSSSGNSSSVSFQNFKKSVDDVWDCRVTDNELTNESNSVSTDVTICKTIAEAAAISVINNHKTRLDNSCQKHSIPPKNYNNQLVFSSTSKKQSDDGTSRLSKFKTVLQTNVLELNELKKLSWSGVPSEIRADTWRLLAGYLPANIERRKEVLERKRLDYLNLVQQYYHTDRDEIFQDIYHQIHIDIPRMSPLISLFQQKTVQEIFERILFIWAIRHPASGYVQGINDLVTPFFVVFLQEVLTSENDVDKVDISSIPLNVRNNVEADSFWCLSKFLDSIQDNYIFAQLGIQHKVSQLKDLIHRIDLTLHKHLQKHDVDYLQFSFRWMNNLLTRELPLRCSIRLWDTYLAESDTFASFQLYVCAAFLLYWRDKLLLEKDFQGLMIMLQNLPTQDWNDSHISVLVAEAYRLKFIFADAPNHLQTNNSWYDFYSILGTLIYLQFLLNKLYYPPKRSSNCSQKQGRNRNFGYLWWLCICLIGKKMLGL